jgi:hypothetical protein
LVGEVSGTRAYLLEICEQLAWLGAALQPSSLLEGVSFSTPVVEKCAIATTTSISQSASSARGICCKITFRVENLDRELMPSNGQCWHNLFRNPIIVQGYPILNRPKHCTGLEISLRMMAGLAQARYLNMFCSRPIIKGFSTMFYPSYQSGDSLIWHLVYNEDGSHISYMQGVTCYTLSVSIPEIERSRHILGWCSEAKLYAGKKHFYSLLEVSKI